MTGDPFAKPVGPVTTLQMLVRYRCWAIDLTLRAAAELSDAELEKARPTTFGSILNTLIHIHIVDQIFRAHIEGREHGYRSRRAESPLPLRELRPAMTALDHWLIGVVDQLSPSDLLKAVDYRSVDGEPNTMSFEEILFHLINHATYHIGYVSDLMYQIPTEPPTTDLTVFLRDVWRRY